MRKWLIVAGLLAISMVGARAESFYFGGQRIHIGRPCLDISCLFGGRRWSRHAWRHHGRRHAKVIAPVVAATPDIAPAETSAPQPAAAVEPLTAPNNIAAITKSTDRIEQSPPPSTESTPSRPADVAAKPAEVAALPADADTPGKASPPIPIGNWSSREGAVSIETCGEYLCGYASGGRHAGAIVLINMRPSRKNTWVGRVHDFRSGGTYSARMTVRGPDTLRVEGCAFNGMICDGRTLARIN